MKIQKKVKNICNVKKKFEYDQINSGTFAENKYKACFRSCNILIYLSQLLKLDIRFVVCTHTYPVVGLSALTSVRIDLFLCI